MTKTLIKKWSEIWKKNKCFTPKKDGSKPKYYVLSEFPFPSGSGFHAGHMLNYTGSDVLARYKRKKGFDVLFPLGFDSMGITAEGYAVKLKKHPSVVVNDLIEKFKASIENIGWSVDPESQISTSDPSFIKWTQWMFIQFFKAGLAYKSKLPMNWCPSCRTTLTNEELEGGLCNRCGTKTEVKEKLGWNLSIRKYADRLISGLEKVDYPEKVKRDQINWIGKSEGACVRFPVLSENFLTLQSLEVFTSKLYTIFGTSFIAVAPESSLAFKLKLSANNGREIDEYIKQAKDKDEIERTGKSKEKTGVCVDGVFALNPFSGEVLPIFIADYVLSKYGTGAVMGVPSLDERDKAFADAFNLPVKEISEGSKLINSGKYSGLSFDEAGTRLVKDSKLVRKTTMFKLSDWGFSRQMYWGEPIPIVWCEKCGFVPNDEKDLPILQPFMEDYRPTEDGESPLSRSEEFVNTTCPCCFSKAKQETDTMPAWAGSSWYFLRYLDPNNEEAFVSPKIIDEWMPVDTYNGGNEHNTRHLLYSRFWHKALFDLGFVNTDEPYKKRTTNGLLLGKDGKKMSKSKGNGFLMEEKLDEIGADASRLAVLSLGEWKDNVIWSDGAESGAIRFLKRISNFAENLEDRPLSASEEYEVNKLIKETEERTQNQRFNTAISGMMEFINKFDRMPKPAFMILLNLLNPYAPFITEELNEKLGGDLLALSKYPEFDASKLTKNTSVLSVSINGKGIGEIEVKASLTQEEIEKLAKENFAKKLECKEISKVIFIPNRTINFIVR